ncbi:hypothetical protein [Amycolatopsis echigonensis]|uniref:hypothetical protein n=1 Tax=Amycolatopsis echigonensis TaxID=2576905 RepID=UPI001C7F3F60|nr:hypothetical protein [Amycolatopsis echigonensis]
MRGGHDVVAAEEFGRLDVGLLDPGVPGRFGLADFTEPSYRDSRRTNVDDVGYGLRACHWCAARARGRSS